jgi:hypothetical protein
MTDLADLFDEYYVARHSKDKERLEAAARAIKERIEREAVKPWRDLVQRAINAQREAHNDIFAAALEQEARALLASGDEE